LAYWTDILLPDSCNYQASRVVSGTSVIFIRNKNESFDLAIFRTAVFLIKAGTKGARLKRGILSPFPNFTERKRVVGEWPPEGDAMHHTIALLDKTLSD
jgi:hypothetical protein